MFRSIHALRSSTILALLGMTAGGGILSFPASPTPHGPERPEWLTVLPGGETSCGFDTPFEFWVREGAPSRVLIYLQGGGGCWDFESCHPDRRIQFTTRIDATAHAQRVHGIFDRAAPENPFREHTTVFVPYCTGDFHLGARRVTHAPPPGDDSDPITVNHAGFANVGSVLAYLAALPSPPDHVTVIGGSAGAVASPIVAAEVADLFPRAEVRQLGDGVAGLRLDASREILALWGADSILGSRGYSLPSDGDAFAGLYRAAASRHPAIRFSQVATTEDRRISEGLALFGADPAELPSLIARTYEELGEALPCFAGYALPGEEHTILWRPDFFTARVEGEPLPRVLEREVIGAPCPGEDPASGDRRVERAIAEVRAAAGALLDSLTPAQVESLRFGPDDPVRTTWTYTPFARPGLSLKALRPPQRELAHDLLRTLLSHQGYLKVNAIVGLEGYLQMVERSGFPRDPEAYVMVLFGSPRGEGEWGFRFEGHHVSVNATFGAVEELSVTPLFLGANPATVPTGPQAGLRILAPEEDLARRLLQSMDEQQRLGAVVSDEAPLDIFTTNEAFPGPLERVGLLVSEMSAGQRQLLFDLIEVYVTNLRPELAEREWEGVPDMIPQTLRFAWFGGSSPGEPHYYRIQGESFLIEYDHVSNHIHTVWRDLERDFGRDFLGEHHGSVRHHRTSEPASSEFWFVRHAESEFNRVGGVLPEPDEGVSYPLTQAGIHQAAALGSSFTGVEVRAIYSSTRLRAIQTADAISTRTGVPVRLSPEIVEIDFGAEADLREIPALAQEWVRGNPEARLRGAGENLNEARERFRPFWNGVRSNYESGGGVVVVVTHGGLISVALPGLCEELTLEDTVSRRIRNAEVVKARLEEGRLICYDWNGEAIPPR